MSVIVRTAFAAFLGGVVSATAAAAAAGSPDEIFEWAEWKYPHLFPRGQQTTPVPYQGFTYQVRGYPTGNYLGIDPLDEVYGHGPFVGNVLTWLGKRSSYSRQVNEDRCLFAFASCKVAGASQAINRAATQWLIFRSTSPVDGSRSVRLVASSTGGDFEILCRNGSYESYYLTTPFVTGSGRITYRIGNTSAVEQTWRESPSNGYRALFPPSSPIATIRAMYMSNDVIFSIPRFGGGNSTADVRAEGLSAAIDATRTDCSWSNAEFPPANGWGDWDLTDVVPPHAVDGTYKAGAAEMFSVAFWRATSPLGPTRLLARVAQDKTKCKGGFLIGTNRLYVTQQGKRVEASPGHTLSLSCGTDKPVTLVLQGAFDPTQPMTVSAHPFHFNALEPGEPFATASLP